MFTTTLPQELYAMIDRNEDLVLVDVLPQESYLRQHLPGAINIPIDSDNFETLVEDLIPDKSKLVIVYCEKKDCDESLRGAQRIAAMGYKNVSDYETGLEGWEQQGYEFDQ
ncbi:MAG: Rhodanese-like protein [uncultured bacterium]|nr:MAG: Rhodanese-like protein [uncultured bacterium]